LSPLWDQLCDVSQVEGEYGGLEVSEARQLRQLEDENARLKRLLADAMLDNAMLKEIEAKKW
jgi:putative transposase